MQALALWIHFVGWLRGSEPLVVYIVVCWGLAVLVLVLTIIIASYALDLDLSSSEGLYGPVKDL